MNAARVRGTEPGKTPVVGLDAYLATALTSLTAAERREMHRLSDVIADVCAGHSINLYEPRQSTDPVHNPDVPDWHVFDLDRRRVAASDLVIMLADFPSVGAGQELVIAKDYLVPVVVVCGSDRRLSRMISGMPGVVNIVRYQTDSELTDRLGTAVTELRDLLTAGRSTPTEASARFANALREHRLALGWSREQLASAVSPAGAITAVDVAAWESDTDVATNPSLVLLRAVATALGVHVHALVH